MCEGLGCTTPLQLIQMMAGLSTVGIAAIVAFITFQQWKTNQAGLREKLFERRFAIFKETQSFLSMLTGKDDDLDIEIWRFSDTCQRAKFLFGPDVFEHLERIRLRAIESQFQQSIIRNPQHHEDHMDHIRQYTTNKNWYFAQLKEIFTLFSPYLSFKIH